VNRQLRAAIKDAVLVHTGTGLATTAVWRPRRGDGDTGASAGALASRGETDDGRVVLWVRFTATERRERGAAHRVLIEPSLDDPYTALLRHRSGA
jgi:hypothetical protein